MNCKRSFTLVSCLALFIISSFYFSSVNGENPYKFFTFEVTYGHISPLGVLQQGILINGQFPGPEIHAVTNDNIVVNVINRLPEPFLLNGIQQRKNSFEDGVYGATCPIPPGKNFTYKMQAKDQIGSFFYFPSTGFHKAAGGYGAIRIVSRPLIPVPFPPPSDDYTILIGDWYKTNHMSLKGRLDNGKMIRLPDGVLINGKGSNGSSFSVIKGYTYRFRISNVGLRHSLNIRIQGHKMKLVEVEGTHTIQTRYDSLDVHLGQSCSILVTFDQEVKDYYIAVSTRFTDKILTTTGILHYSGSKTLVSGPPPDGPSDDFTWSLQQARTIRTNLTASGPRPNPQGSYHYGEIPINRTIRLESSASQIGGKQRYAINGMSFVPSDTPLKLADYFNISNVFKVDSIPYEPNGEKPKLETSVMGADYRAFVEIVFENPESIVQSWHLDGYNFFVVGMDGGSWTPKKRKQYNLNDAIWRCTTQLSEAFF
ncbi:hypothetical protein V2J09_020061 [Rumex salicifolius]